MHLCCGRMTSHKKSKKSEKTSRIFASNENPSSVSVRNNYSKMYGEVKQSKLNEETDEEEEENAASVAVSTSEQTLALQLHSLRVSCEEESSTSALRVDVGQLSTFRKVVPHKVPPNKQDLIEYSDYDNTTIFNYNNAVSPDLPCLSGVVNSLHSDVDMGSKEKICVTADMTSTSASVPNEAILHFPVQTSKPSAGANILELDSVLALMMSMTENDIPPAPVQRSSLFQHRTREHEALRSPETSLTTETSLADDPQNLISTEKTSIPSSGISVVSPFYQFVVDIDDENLLSATPVRLNPSSELRPQGAAAVADDNDNGTSGCLSSETDVSLTPVSASSSGTATQMLHAAKYDENSNSTICLDYYSIHENTKYSDPNNLDINSPPQKPSSSSSLSSGICLQTETVTSSTTEQETTARTTSENQTYFENATEDSICKPCQRRSPQLNCLTSEMEECPALTSSGGNVAGASSDVNLMVYDVAMNSVPTPVDQFKALRLDILKATSKLLDFVGEIWRRQESLNDKLSKINLLCLHLKTGLQELENFGLSLVSHLSEEERLMSEKKLFSQMKLLQNIRNGINRYLEGLEKETLSKHIESSQQYSDESLRVKVGNIILLTKVIPGLVRTFGSFVDDIVKADFSNKPVVNSETDSCSHKSPSSDSHPTEDPGPIASDLSAQDLTCESDFRISNKEENPPAIPPKSFRSAKTTSDSKMIYENKYNCGEDYMRATSCFENPSNSENTMMLIAENPSVDDSAVREAEGSVVGVTQSKSVCHPCFVASDPLEGPPSVVFRRKRPISPTALHSTANDSSNDGNDDLESRFSTSELVTPDIRSSGISLTVQTRLEELQRQATSQNVMLHTDADCSFMDYDLPAGIMDESLPNLCESDCKLLLYYSDEMFSHWKVLDSAASAFFQCMEMSQLPKVFLMHSKFVLVAGHKMAYIGDVLARNVTDGEARDWLLAYSNDLCERLKYAVRTTKAAALAFPAVKPLQLMVDAIKVVTDSAYELRELLFRLAYLGRAEQPFSW